MKALDVFNQEKAVLGPSVIVKTTLREASFPALLVGPRAGWGAEPCVTMEVFKQKNNDVLFR